MAPTHVAIAGAGIAGPVLAMLLKQKGYNPVLYERTEYVTSAGLSLVLQPNGLKVLRLIPGLIDSIPAQILTHIAVFSTLPPKRETPLVFYEISKAIEESNSENSKETLSKLTPDILARGVQREALQRVLVQQAEARGIKIHWGYHLNGLKEVEVDDCEPEVELTFANGKTARASFVVGCDGLHSNTRTELFGEMNPDYTGLVQTGGMSPRPNFLGSTNALCNVLGINAHMIAYPITDEYYSWAITQSEEEHKESWRAIDAEKKEAFTAGPISEWGFGVGEMVRTTTKVIKYGLYDRPELKTWYKGRVVLLGDAAHPTTPHLGQGANQAFEDIYHLVLGLCKHHFDVNRAPTTLQLKSAFQYYEGVRLTRSATLVREARERGSLRIASSTDPNIVNQREETFKGLYGVEEMLGGTINYLKYPYGDQSEV